RVGAGALRGGAATGASHSGTGRAARCGPGVLLQALAANFGRLRADFAHVDRTGAAAARRPRAAHAGAAARQSAVGREWLVGLRGGLADTAHGGHGPRLPPAASTSLRGGFPARAGPSHSCPPRVRILA